MPLSNRIEAINAAALIEHSTVGVKLFPEVGCTTLEVGGGTAAFLGAGAPINYAVGMGLNVAVTSSDVKTVVEFYRSRGEVPRIDVSPYADESLINALREHNFQLHWFTNVLTRELSTTDLPPAISSGINVRRAAADEAERWAQTVYAGFEETKPYDETHRKLGLMFFHGRNMHGYFAEINGEIAGAAGMFTDGDYAAFMATSTLPAFRNRGVHTALIQMRLLDAISLGCNVAGLFATPGSISQHNAEKLGFHVLYAKATMRVE